MAQLPQGIQSLFEPAAEALKNAKVAAYAPRSPELVEALATYAHSVAIYVAELSQCSYWQQRMTKAKVTACDIASLAAQPAEQYDVAVLMPHKDRELTNTYLAVAVAQLKLGGVLVVVGAKNEGVEPLEKRAAEQLQKVNKAVLKPLGRGSLYRKTVKAAAAVTVNSFGFQAVHSDLTLQMKTLPGVFSKKSYDAGTQNLLRALELKPGESLLDLGCGPGTVGLMALKAEPSLRVTLVDDDANAVACALANANAARLSPEAIVHSDGLTAKELQGKKFDVIALNPPFHQGQEVSYAIAERLCTEVAEALAPQGHFFMVANQFCPYEKILNARWKNVAVVHTDRSYKVWKCS